MERVSAFLESSTIHGLNYISTTRKYARLFWMLVVLAGFIGAGYMIQTSFQSWAESPIKTTVETLPISEIKFPKVTVCPPRNTFTDLNSDLMLAETFTLTEEMRDELLAYSWKVIDEHVFTDDFDKFLEDDRYYNWYFGYSRMIRTDKNDNGKLTCRIETTATSGVVTTQYFGEQYQPSLVERKVDYQVLIFPPESVRNNSNVTLHLNLEKVSMTDLSNGWDKTKVFPGSYLDAGLTSASFNFTPPGVARVLLNRDQIVEKDLTNIELESMPGFQLSWYYTGLGDNMTPDSKFSGLQPTQLRLIWYVLELPVTLAPKF